MVLMSMSSSLRPWEVVRISNLLLLEKCMPHLGPLTSQSQTLVLAGLAVWPSSPGHDRFLYLDQGKLLVIWMLIPEWKSFLTKM